MEKRTGREGKEEKTKKEKLTQFDLVEAVCIILWLEFILACICLLLSSFLSFETCLYILFGSITTLNGIGSLQIELKLNKKGKEHDKTY